MANEEAEALDLDDNERLPWLEPAAEEPERDVSPYKIGVLVLIGLALLALIVGGGWWIKNREQVAGAGDVDAKLISAQSEPYKIPANEADAKKFQGEGDESFAASEGSEANGKIDASKVPEAPMTDVSRGAITREDAAANAGPAKRAVTAKVNDTTNAKKPAPVAKPASSGGGQFIQLGAYSSQAIAKDAWAKMTKRFDYLAALSSSFEPVTTANGATLYRLRAAVASARDAATLCGKLRVAGENCLVVH